MRFVQIAAVVVALGFGSGLASGCVVEDRRHHTPPGQAKKRSSGGDHNRGHGNDPGGYDPDNPGKGKGKGKKKGHKK